MGRKSRKHNSGKSSGKKASEEAGNDTQHSPDGTELLESEESNNVGNTIDQDPSESGAPPSPDSRRSLPRPKSLSQFNPRTSASLMGTIAGDDGPARQQPKKTRRRLDSAKSLNEDDDAPEKEQEHDKLQLPDTPDATQQVENRDAVLPPAKDYDEYIQQLITYINSDEDCELSEEEALFVIKHTIDTDVAALGPLIEIDLTNTLRVAVQRTIEILDTNYWACTALWKVIQLPQSDKHLESKGYAVGALLQVLETLDFTIDEGVEIAIQCLGGLSSVATSSPQGQQLLIDYEAHKGVCAAGKAYFERLRDKKNKSLESDGFERWFSAFLAFFADGNLTGLNLLVSVQAEQLASKILHREHADPEAISFALMALSHMADSPVAAARMLENKFPSFVAAAMNLQPSDSFTVVNGAELLTKLGKRLNRKEPEVSADEASKICDSLRVLLPMHPEARFKVQGIGIVPDSGWSSKRMRHTIPQATTSFPTSRSNDLLDAAGALVAGVLDPAYVPPLLSIFLRTQNIFFLLQIRCALSQLSPHALEQWMQWSLSFGGGWL